MSDVFSPAGNTLFGLGEGRRLSRARKRQDMMQKVVFCLQHIKDGGRGCQLIRNDDCFCIDINTPCINERVESNIHN